MRNIYAHFAQLLIRIPGQIQPFDENVYKFLGDLIPKCSVADPDPVLFLPLDPDPR
jgi:hypothetical protein